MEANDTARRLNECYTAARAAMDHENPRFKMVSALSGLNWILRDMAADGVKAPLELNNAVACLESGLRYPPNPKYSDPEQDTRAYACDAARILIDALRDAEMDMELAA